ncbi:MAG: efflux RND transporter periplasmic adaptor subunit [Pseudomonadales bacterium]|nr:efflux RND transporter periplasmic adaptor subunit [Pseudomonadales bacterium]
MLIRFHPSKTSRHLLLMALFFALSACGQQEPPAEAEEVVRPVKYITVKAEKKGRTRIFSGISKAGTEASLSFKVAGTLQKVAVKVGDQLNKGDLIARLDRTSFELEMEKANATLAQSEAESRNAKSNNKRVRLLYENSNATRETLDSARAAMETSQARVRSAQKNLQLTRLQLAYTELKAGEPCLVSDVLVEVGENIQSGQKITAVNCGDFNEVLIPVPESMIGNIKQNMPASIRFNAIPNVEFSGTVSEVGVTSSTGATYLVTLLINDQHPNLRSGLTAEITFELASPATGSIRIVIPPVAVGQDSEGRFVFILESSDSPQQAIVRRRTVTIGELTSRGLEIVSGIKPGDRLVIAGVSVIHDGLAVRAE